MSTRDSNRMKRFSAYGAIDTAAALAGQEEALVAAAFAQEDLDEIEPSGATTANKAGPGSAASEEGGLFLFSVDTEKEGSLYTALSTVFELVGILPGKILWTHCSTNATCSLFSCG